MAAVRTAKTMVLVAEPGAGKSSLVPLMVAGEVDGRVVMLQPRRLAARATALRLAALLGESLGDTVGLTMRGERKVSRHCRIEVVTEAVLTNRIQNDPELPGVGAVIFDEFHERSLHADLGLAMAVESRALLRPDLGIIVMSATINPNPIARLIISDSGTTAPVVSVPGRTFPVSTLHHERPSRINWTERIATVTRLALAENDGDALVFVPGRGEVDRVVRALADSSGLEVLGLHGGTGGAQQRDILSGSSARRVIVATTIAETSVTVPGVNIVVDGGLARRPAFDAETGLGSLETGFVTRFGADQRRGRAGRLGPGVCHRLWSAEDERHLSESSEPEIRTGDPLPLAMALARWGDPMAADLPLLDKPDQHRLEAGARTLELLGLVDDTGMLTHLGQEVATMPVHPRHALAVVHAPDGAIRDRVIDLVSAIEEGVRFHSADLEAASQTEVERGRRSARALRKHRRSISPASSDRPPSSVAECLLDVWPDRVGMRRTDRPGRFLLASGTEVQVAENDVLAGAEFIVVAAADGRAPDIRLRAGVVLDRATVLERLAHRIERTDVVSWDERVDRVVAEWQERLGSVVVRSGPLPEPDRQMVERALYDVVRTKGLTALRWTEEATAILHRLRWLYGEAPDEWPNVSDQALLDRLSEWVQIGPAVRPGEIVAGRGILHLLDWRQRKTLDEQAPVTLSPSRGGPRPVDYASGRPVWSVRLQHLFGMNVHPVIGPNRTPVTVELLTPANRPAQTTND
ncbi:MAG: ATP-dependent helicase HrpB, partial [Acidimicrobiales bacterium]|nr:ATP-dependent helicase HrpB [Acidimicrobiales bacterium]